MTAPAPPAPTHRLDPGGRKLGKGTQALFTLALDPDLEIWEDDVTPSGFDSDAPNDTSTQHNSVAHTFSPGELITDSAVMLKCKYDPLVMGTLRTYANQPTVGTTWFPDGSSYAQYGWIKKATPSALVRGTVPTIDIEFFVSNTDPVTCAEELGVYTAGSGTAASC